MTKRCITAHSCVKIHHDGCVLFPSRLRGGCACGDGDPKFNWVELEKPDDLVTVKEADFNELLRDNDLRVAANAEDNEIDNRRSKRHE